MNTSSVYVGIIKKCNNVNGYNTYCDTHYEGDSRLKTVEFGSIKEYTKIIDSQAILIKTKDNRYIPFKLISSLGEMVLVKI